MRNEKILKLAALNIGIAVIDIIVFSDGFLHINIIGGSIFSTAFGITVVIMSVGVFVLGNYQLLYQKDKTIQTSEIKTIEDCIHGLEENYRKRIFTEDISTILEQIKRFEKKKETISDILLQKFSSSEMSYSKFQGVILEVEKVFFLNIKSILNRLNAFDEEDYNQIKNDSLKMKFSKEFIQTKLSIYGEYISFVKESKEDNEEVLLKLDKVLLEISKFNSLEDGELENMSAMKEIDELISNAKWFK